MSAFKLIKKASPKKIKKKCKLKFKKKKEKKKAYGND